VLLEILDASVAVLEEKVGETFLCLREESVADADDVWDFEVFCRGGDLFD